MTNVPTPEELSDSCAPTFDELVDHLLKKCIYVLDPHRPRSVNIWGVSDAILTKTCQALNEKGWSTDVTRTPYPQLTIKAS